MRESIKGHHVIRSITTGAEESEPMKVHADSENLYIPQVIIYNDEKILYYLEIPKSLLKEGVGAID